MRKMLIGLLLISLLAIFAAMVISGFSIGDFTLGHSIQEIINKNDELDSEIVGLSSKIEKEYQIAKSNLDASFKKLQAEKQSYQETVAYTNSEELGDINQTEQYKLDYIWTNIGLYATKNNLIMRADVSNGTSGVTNQYNIAFSAIGEYLSISEFIYAIEKDPNLGFRIEEFALAPYSDEQLQATFIIKNVSLDQASLSASATIPSGTVIDNTDSTTNNNSNNNNNNNNNNSANTNNGSNNANNNNNNGSGNNNTNKNPNLSGI